MEPTWGVEQEFNHNVWPAVEKVHGWMSKAQLAVLYALAAGVPLPGCIVEIGCWQGRSSIALAWAGRTTYCVDPWDCSGDRVYTFDGDLHAKWLENTRNAGVAPIPLIGTSEKVNRTWTGAIDLLTIDGDHSYAAVKQDYKLWSPFVKAGGVVVFDDCREAGPRKVIQELHGEWATTPLEIEKKLFIAIKKGLIL